MRTTVTLDEDVAAKLRETARQRGVSFKRVLNDALRDGLMARSRPRKFAMPTRDLGVKPEIDIDRALRLAGELEDEETLRKLARRK